MSQPVVTIIVPFYRRTEFLKESIESVLTQTCSQWELLLINDDEMKNEEMEGYVATLANKRISILKRRSSPKGAPTCRNLGLQHAKGEYVIFLDSDDLLGIHCVEQRLEIMKRFPKLDFAVFPMILFEHSIVDGKYLWNVVNDEDDLQRFLRIDAVWQTSGPIWKKSFLQKIGGFTEGLVCWQDVDLHLKALFNNPVYQKFYDLKPDCFYRKHKQGSISQDRINTIEKLQSRETIFRKALLSIDQMQNDQKQSCQNIAVMLISILLSAIRSGHNSFLLRIFFDYRSRGVLTNNEKWIILSNFFLHNLRLTRLIFLNTLDQSYVRCVASKMGIGKHKLTME